MASEFATCGSPVHSLARMLDFGAGQQPLWDSDELGAIFQHQLDAALEPDLSRVEPALRDRLGALADVGEPLGTFRDLFRHAHPPLELLEATKRFAKYARVQEELLPAETATVLYFLAIAAARTRCGRRITALADEALQHGLSWARQQAWLDANSREVLSEAERLLVR